MKYYEGDQRTLGFMLEDKAQLLKDKVFAYYKDETLTYEELNEKANRIANSLIKENGVSKGDRVAVMFSNCMDYILVQFGIAKSGGLQVPVNVEARGELLAHFLNNSVPRVLIIDQSFLPLLKDIEHMLNQAPKLIVRSSGVPVEQISFEKGFETVSFKELFTGSPDPPPVEIRRIDPIDIFYTSGTTGVSKGVVLPHNHHYVFPLDIVEHGRLGPDDIFYTCLPYYHGVSQFMVTIPALLMEGSVALADRFSVSRFWGDIRKYNATALWAVYTMPSLLMKQPEREDDRDNPLRVFFTIGIDPEIEEAFEKRFNVRVVQAYGSTEQGPLSWTPYDISKYGTVGKVNDKFYEVKIVDEEDEEVPGGTVGEIVSRAKKPWIRMVEYYNMPENTCEMYRNLWMHGGDLGYVDDEGWLYFVGRQKDAIRRRGENISAYEFESQVLGHPAVVECAAIPIPGEFGEDDVKVVVVLKEQQELSPKELIAFCEQKMPRYMVPRYVEFMASLPKTGTEKVEKVKLREQAFTPDTWDAGRGNYLKYLGK